MDGLTDELRQESPWTMVFADDSVIYSELKNDYMRATARVETRSERLPNEKRMT